jgi:fusicocca-2,10(14)-diene synthase/ophiobolin F synthase
MLSQRRAVGEMTLEQKKVLLQHLKDRGSLEYTRDAMAVLMAEIRSLSSQMGLLENAKWTALLEAVAV